MTGVGVGDGLLVTGWTVVGGALVALGSLACGVCELAGAEPAVDEGSVVVVGCSVLVGAELLLPEPVPVPAPVPVAVPVAVPVEVLVVGGESVSLSGVTVVLLSLLDPAALRSPVPLEREWPAGAELGAEERWCSGRVAEVLAARRACLMSLAAACWTAAECSGLAVLAGAAWVLDRTVAG